MPGFGCTFSYAQLLYVNLTLRSGWWWSWSLWCAVALTYTYRVCGLHPGPLCRRDSHFTGFLLFLPKKQDSAPEAGPEKRQHVVGECAEQGEPWGRSASWEGDGGGSHLAEGRALWVSQWISSSWSLVSWRRGEVLESQMSTGWRSWLLAWPGVIF